MNFPAVLVNHRTGSELISGNVIDAEFDSNTDFDFSTTGPPTDFEESLFSTAVHEILHGLGFFSDIEEDGFFFDGLPAIFDTFLVAGSMPLAAMNDAGRKEALVSDDLFFNGPSAVAANPLGIGPVKIHAPSAFEQGSTGSHLDRATFASFGDLMLPEASASFAEKIFLSSLDTAILSDLGFALASPSVDLDSDGDVDGNDLLIIQHTDPSQIPAWKAAFGSVAGGTALVATPEPATISLLAMFMLGFVVRTR